MTTPMTAEECEKLLPYAATEVQRQGLLLIKEHGSITKAMKAMGLKPGDGHLKNIVARVRAHAAKQGFAPDHGWSHPVPETHIAKGVSRYYRLDDGGIWVKADLDQQEREALAKEALDGLKGDIPRAKKQAKPKHSLAADLLSFYVVTDHHIGGRSWPEETGDDWNMRIAEDLLVGWLESAISLSPNAEVGVLAQMGDLLHYDSLEAVTPTSKHQLDADTRYQMMVRVGIRVMRRCISMLLDKHDRVHLIMAEGNHDPAGSAWLREAFALFYENEPRVTVDLSPSPFYAYQWGKTALFVHHGHKRGVKNVAEALAREFREIYGQCNKAYAHLGHMHHKDVKEQALMHVEQHPTLAGRDSYASSLGLHADRAASVIQYHKEFGEIGRVTIPAEMVGS